MSREKTKGSVVIRCEKGAWGSSKIKIFQDPNSRGIGIVEEVGASIVTSRKKVALRCELKVRGRERAVVVCRSGGYSQCLNPFTWVPFNHVLLSFRFSLLLHCASSLSTHRNLRFLLLHFRRAPKGTASLRQITLVVAFSSFLLSSTAVHLHLHGFFLVFLAASPCALSVLGTYLGDPLWDIFS